MRFALLAAFPLAVLTLNAVAAPLAPASSTASAARGEADALPQLKAYEVPPAWRTPIAPLQITDHVWQVGAAGITALLVKTDAGAVLIDGGMPQMADALLANLRKLGVAPNDLRLVLHTHAHADHVGPFAAILRATGATLVSNAESAMLLARGGAHDLHFGDDILFPPVQAGRLLQDGEAVHLGTTVFTVHFTPGHTPGSMSWTWTDTQRGAPVRIAYVDSLSAPGYRLVGNPAVPRLLETFFHSADIVRSLPCDLLLTPHPDASGWNYADAAHPHPSPMTCAAYADEAVKRLQRQAEAQRAGKS